MTSLAKSFKNHREAARSRRAIVRALENATTPGAREDLIVAWQRSEDLRKA
ncbi:hypothetical protein G9U51_00290 [Calidifontibacter sp. DB0510]|uniref:Uncharacterized protein n=1 Tax=Metallococcus carri TaxID=1656884 RepID=A0A967B239_9MICO|nr:hypothetical protein [Metallococcus carri]NHN54222.1 hypothetical protein [Metallococcus carri]NOP36938.1 hypothetical protein [Calidifontibacter sp. DB2511S]